ncbi:phage P2 GpU [gamma proteobacterium HTCC5015]|nr:phage P2 GpU [gamma proteobacterium HTCC5015]
MFDVATAPYQTLERTTQWRHSVQNPVGERPNYQFLGPGEDSITLSGTLYPHFTGGRLSLDALRVMAEQGKGWPLIEGSGRLYGFWAVTKVRETSTHFMRDGVPKKIEFSVSLKRVDDKRLDLLAAALDAGLVATTGLLAKPLNKARNALSDGIRSVTRIPNL